METVTIFPKFLVVIPRSVRDKLDRVGIKLHLKEWQALDLPARELLCNLPCETADEVGRYAATVEQLVLKVTGKPAERLVKEQAG